MNAKKHILIAPLNWGLAYARRCVPVINALLSGGYKVTLASDGDALELLRREFPHLPAVALPGCPVSPKAEGKPFNRTFFLQKNRVKSVLKKEHARLNTYIDTLKLDGVISDSRLGMYSARIPSVIISHQLTALSGAGAGGAPIINRHYLHKFDACWVPDYEGIEHLSGHLGHPTKKPKNIRYIGPISPMEKTTVPQKYEVTVLLSGQEPQRSKLEKTLLAQLKKFNGRVLLVRGVLEEEVEVERKQLGTIEVVNFLTAKDLEKAFNESGFIISRPEYTTVMDLASLQKKVFFITAPGQPEENYLATYLQKRGIAPYEYQDNFKIKNLSKLSIYKGFNRPRHQQELSDFFCLFEREGELRAHPEFTFNIHFLLMRLNNMFNYREPQA